MQKTRNCRFGMSSFPGAHGLARRCPAMLCRAHLVWQGGRQVPGWSKAMHQCVCRALVRALISAGYGSDNLRLLGTTRLVSPHLIFCRFAEGDPLGVAIHMACCTDSWVSDPLCRECPLSFDDRCRSWPNQTISILRLAIQPSGCKVHADRTTFLYRSIRNDDSLFRCLFSPRHGDQHTTTGPNLCT